MANPSFTLPDEADEANDDDEAGNLDIANDIITHDFQPSTFALQSLYSEITR